MVGQIGELGVTLSHHVNRLNLQFEAIMRRNFELEGKVVSHGTQIEKLTNEHNSDVQ